ncbi:MAG: YcxB family protein [Colwellia sp.]|nr:YcxB family protein [Colwellia sp.]
MTTAFSYSTTYILDKSHFSETFDESVIVDTSKTVYFKSVVLALFGLAILLFTEVNPYAAWFIVALGAIEALSIRFRKSWWLARQMLSKAANAEMTLTIDEQDVCSKSFYVESKISWPNINKIEQTSHGWLLYHSQGKNYISGRCLSEQASDFIAQQAILKAH